MRSTMKSSGLALALAAGCWMMMATDAEACSGRQSGNPNGTVNMTANMTAARRLNLALAKLRVPPKDPAESANQKKPEDIVPPNPPNIVGLWDVQFLEQGQVVGETYDMWHADGTEIEVDALDPILGNVCNGVWVQASTLTWKLTHPSWSFDQNGNLNGTVMFYEVVTLDLKGDTYQGTISIDVFDLNGVPVDHEDGTITAKRIKPV